jgi:hypothetical protein
LPEKTNIKYLRKNVGITHKETVNDGIAVMTESEVSWGTFIGDILDISAKQACTSINLQHVSILNHDKTDHLLDWQVPRDICHQHTSVSQSVLSCGALQPAIGFCTHTSFWPQVQGIHA